MRDYGQGMTREGPIVPEPVTWADIERAFPGAMARDAEEYPQELALRLELEAYEGTMARSYILPEECYPEVTLADIAGDFLKLATLLTLAVGIPLALYVL